MIRNAPTKNYYNEVLRLVPDGSASGSVASFDDGAKDCPLKSLVVDIEPIQSGSGTPSPDNVRPISARSEVVVTRTGKNLFNKDDSTLYRNLYLNSSTGVVGSISGERTAVLPCKPSTTYTISALITTTLRFASFTAFPSVGRNPTAVISPSGQTPATTGRTITTGANDKYLAIQLVANADIESGTTVADVANVLMLEVGSTATAYEPYTAQTITISLGQSIYGGQLDVVKGELVIDRAIVNMSDIGWVYDTSYTYPFFFTTSISNAKKTAGELTCMCDMYECITNKSSANFRTHDYAYQICFSYTASGNRLYLQDPECTSVEALMTRIANGHVVYNLVEPISVSIDPTEIRTLYGINNIWSDSGETAVTYRANATLLYEKIRNAIIAQGGNV